MNQKRIELLEYKVRLLHNMITDTETYDKYFWSFIIDHNITEEQTNTILQGLTVLNQRKEFGGITDTVRKLIDDNDCLGRLVKDEAPNFSEFSRFITDILGEDINPRHLLKSILKQGIYIEMCEYLLET